MGVLLTGHDDGAARREPPRFGHQGRSAGTVGDGDLQPGGGLFRDGQVVSRAAGTFRISSPDRARVAAASAAYRSPSSASA
ncbi:hypothetical protein MTP03_10720 [Tsukamurella sp. PLM1]|nr:hypothetical protein MTP03_10720 [Tsukamurella sp. PLM1]